MEQSWISQDNDQPPPSQERRVHVRAQPLAELPAQVAIIGDDDTKLQIANLGLGGIGIWVQRGTLRYDAGDRVRLRLRLGDTELETNTIVRHVSDDRTSCGLEVVELSVEDRRTINRYVSELIERGA